MLFANLPDIIDWVIIRNYYWLKKREMVFDISIIHKNVIDTFSRKCFSWLLDLRENSWSALNEVILLIVIIYLILLF